MFFKATSTALSKTQHCC